MVLGQLARAERKTHVTIEPPLGLELLHIRPSDPISAIERLERRDDRRNSGDGNTVDELAKARRDWRGERDDVVLGSHTGVHAYGWV